MFLKSEIVSIGELRAIGGRNLTPIFSDSNLPTFVFVTEQEFKKVQGDKELMKELAIQKLNNQFENDTQRG